MDKLDPNIFVDVADHLNLKSPAFVEKDYYGVQLLKLFSELETEEWEFIFAGGTCLSKVHLNNLGRMSEDIDIKFTTKLGFEKPNKSKRKNLRKKVTARASILGSWRTSIKAQDCSQK